MRRIARASACAALWIGICAGVASGQDDARADGDVQDWYQWRGNSARSGVSTFEGLREAPQVAWEIKLPGGRVSNIVTWFGNFYVAHRDKHGAVLRAYSAADGEPRGLFRMRGAGAVRLAVADGLIIAQAQDACYFVTHKGNTLRQRTRWNASNPPFVGHPLVHGDTLYVIEGPVVHERSVTGSAESESVHPGASFVSVVREGDDERVVVVSTGSRVGRAGDWLSASIPGFRAVPIQPAELPTTLSMLMNAATQSMLLRVGGSQKGGWMFVGPWAVRGKTDDVQGVFFPDRSDLFYPYGIVSEVVVPGGVAIGWTAEDELVSVAPDGRRILLSADAAPEGFSGRRLSVAGNTLYVGNAGVDLESGRVLWCMKDVEPTTSMIPTGDGRFLVATDWRRLIGVAAAPAADPDAGAATAAGGASAVSAVPADTDGVLLGDGRHVTGGKVEILGDGRVRVTPKDGAVETFEPGDVAVATRDGEAIGPRDQFLACRVWRNALRREHGGRLAVLARECVTERLLKTARELLDRARDLGLDEESLADVVSRMAGLSENSSAHMKADRVAQQVAALDAEFEVRVMSAVEWLETRDLPAAAAALLTELDGVAATEEWTKKARELMPSAFPWSGDDDAGRRWAVWARALLPSGARFVRGSPREVPALGRAPWSEFAIVLASRNLQLVSRCTDPEVVGGCLQRGEAAVVALETLFLGGEDRDVLRHDPMVVLLHRSDEEYHAESTTRGGAPAWSAGYYSPSEVVSRFFVPTNGATGDPLGRSLYSTLAHELTHHWIDRRWAPKRRSGSSSTGFWVSEGIAQFVGDQVADSNPHDVRLDNSHVPSLDAMAQAAVDGKALALSKFLNMSRSGFAGLGDEPVVTVRLRNTLASRRLSERSLFYEQSAALTWFLMNRRGEDGRKRVLRYLWAHYSGNAPMGGWASLGFATPSLLGDELAKFLEELAGRTVELDPGPPARAGPDVLPDPTPR